MAFRQPSNQAEDWIWFLSHYPDLLADLRLSPAILRAEHRFRDLLRDGYARAGSEDGT